jgi:hypothetical protein
MIPLQKPYKIKEQRSDSTQIMTNIKLAGRLSLAYDVLALAVKACPPEILTNALKNVLKAEYKTKALYKSKGSETLKLIQEIIELGLELITLTESNSEIGELNAIDSFPI